SGLHLACEEATARESETAAAFATAADESGAAWTVFRGAAAIWEKENAGRETFAAVKSAAARALETNPGADVGEAAELAADVFSRARRAGAGARDLAVDFTKFCERFAETPKTAAFVVEAASGRASASPTATLEQCAEICDAAGARGAEAQFGAALELLESVAPVEFATPPDDATLAAAILAFDFTHGAPAGEIGETPENWESDSQAETRGDAAPSAKTAGETAAREGNAANSDAGTSDAGATASARSNDGRADGGNVGGDAPDGEFAAGIATRSDEAPTFDAANPRWSEAPAAFRERLREEAKTPLAPGFEEKIRLYRRRISGN
ncbi:MAG: hypothetical protein HUK22_05700, partial [Thermoguttaceae bacterium]|nr:hypothetical protein [Thermoguttaceae bacterium]